MLERIRFYFDPDMGATAVAEPTAAGVAETMPATVGSAIAEPATEPETQEWSPEPPPVLPQPGYQTGWPQEYYPQQPQAQPQSGFQFDPFSEDAGSQLEQYFGGQLAQRDQVLLGAIEQLIAPLHAAQESQQIELGHSQALETFQGYTDLGEFDHDPAFGYAQDYMQDALARYGGDPSRLSPAFQEELSDWALRQGAAARVAEEKRIGERYHQRKLEEMKNIGNAQGTPAGRGAGVQQVTTGDYRSGGTVADRFFSRG